MHEFMQALVPPIQDNNFEKLLNHHGIINN